MSLITSCHVWARSMITPKMGPQGPRWVPRSYSNTTTQDHPTPSMSPHSGSWGRGAEKLRGNTGLANLDILAEIHPKTIRSSVYQ